MGKISCPKVNTSSHGGDNETELYQVSINWKFDSFSLFTPFLLFWGYFDRNTADVHRRYSSIQSTESTRIICIGRLAKERHSNTINPYWHQFDGFHCDGDRETRSILGFHNWFAICGSLKAVCGSPWNRIEQQTIARVHCERFSRWASTVKVPKVQLRWVIWRSSRVIYDFHSTTTSTGPGPVRFTQSTNHIQSHAERKSN